MNPNEGKKEANRLLFPGQLQGMHRIRCIVCDALLVLAAVPVLSAAADQLPFGAWKRLSEQPIITPRGDSWESAGTFNPSVVLKDDRFVMLYRDQNRFSRRRWITKKTAGWKIRDW
jgi:hypothetical protein